MSMNLVQTVLGGEVDYEATTRTITANIAGKRIVMIVDELNIEIEGQSFEYGVAPTVIEGSTLVPLRAFEQVVSKLDWDGETQTVIITP